MPILRGAVTFARFQVEHADAPPKDVRGWLTRALRSRAFEPLDRNGEEDRATGFVELEDPEATEFSVGALFQGERALFAYRVEQLKIPARTLKAELEKWVRAFEVEHGHPPRRAEKAESRELLRKKLRARVEPRVNVVDVSWNLASGQLQLWTTSKKVLEELQGLLEERLKLRLVSRSVAGRARAAKVDVEQLAPTAALFGAEVGDGAA
jgi:DNA recombination-dependent growth factor C